MLMVLSRFVQLVSRLADGNQCMRVSSALEAGTVSLPTTVCTGHHPRLITNV